MNTVLSENYGQSLIQVKQASVQKKGKQPAGGSKTGEDPASTILYIPMESAEDFINLLAETHAWRYNACQRLAQLLTRPGAPKSCAQAVGQ